MPKRNKPLLVKKRPLANNDLYDIWRYIAKNNEARATGFIRKLNEAFLLLAQNPKIGCLRDELSENLRSYPVGNYLIFYRIIGQEMAIVRVLYGACDLPALSFDANDDKGA